MGGHAYACCLSPQPLSFSWVGLPSLLPRVRYATFCALAGVDPRDPQTGVPDIDSMNVWPALVNQTQPADFPRQEVPLAYCTPEADCDENNAGTGMVDAALIVGNYKIVTGTQGGLGYWQGPQFPNGSVPHQDPGCPHGCLFDIVADPEEHHDLRAEQPELFQQVCFGRKGGGLSSLYMPGS